MKDLLQRLRLNSIGPRIGLSIIALVLLVATGIGWFCYAQQEQLAAMSIEVRLSETYDQVKEALKSREGEALVLSHAVANTPGVVEHIEANDRVWLLEKMGALAKTISERRGIDLANIHLANGKNLLRWHNPNIFGDDVATRRKSVRDALSSGKPQAGLEPGREFLGLFAVVPIRSGDKIIAVADAGTSLRQPFAEAMKKKLGIDIAFHVARDNAFDTLAGTVPNKTLLSDAERKSAMSDRIGTREVDLGGKAAVVSAAPLVNFAGAPIGVIEMVMDTSDIAARSARAFYILIGVTVAAVVLGFVVSLLLARWIGKPIREMTTTMGSLAEGQLDQDVPHTGRHDEIGQMAKAVLVFRDAGREKIRLEAEAAEQRRTADEERRRNAEAQARSAEEQAHAVQALADGLEKLSQGDLTVQLDDGFAATYQRIKDDFNSAVLRLQQTVQALAASTREVSNAAGEISTSTTDLSQRTEEQAASLEETSASMEQISATVKKNAENAQQANRSTSGTLQIADRGGQVVGKAVSAMARIEERSARINEIIGVIDEIARQTNLLALNAAVEAARAGEAGRGFAVVAAEVRTLAQRSSQAAKDIKELITNSNGQVHEGAELVKAAGASFEEIVASIRQVADIVAGIAEASAEQATGLDQITRALAQMDQVTQQNSALVEENAATARTLEQQSAAMNEQVGYFRLDDADSMVVRRSAA